MRKKRSSENSQRHSDLLPQLKAVPEVVEHLDAQYGRIPFAVVSGARESRRFAVGLGLLEKFAELVRAEGKR